MIKKEDMVGFNEFPKGADRIQKALKGVKDKYLKTVIETMLDFNTETRSDIN